MELNYRQQVAFSGMLIGAALGAIGATLWLEYLSGREIPRTKATTLGWGDMARIATATIALVRQMNELTKEKDEPADVG
ncbi:MAG: hypothetical protein ACRDIB_20055 [Ardenticatenaceae bacterium]